MDILRGILRVRWLLPSILVTALTIGLVAAVVVTSTRVPGSNRVASLGSPRGTPPPLPGTSAPDQSGASSYPPADSGASSPPYDSGASSYPPYDPGASAYPPYVPSVTGYPPVPSAASGTSYPPGYLDCRLPVYVPGQQGSGGFVAIPGGTFIADPKSAVSVPGSPGLSYGLTYDAAYSKWLPVPPTWVSPDGKRYAYPSGGAVYVVDVSSGSQTQLGAGRKFNVLAVQPEGVYATLSPSPGLWLLPYSGPERQLSASLLWEGVSHGSAYGTANTQGAGNTIVRLYVPTGAKTNWFSLAGGTSHMLGFDWGGAPLIQWSSPDGIAIFSVDSGNAEELTFSPTGSAWGATPQGAPLADQIHGIWFPTSGGIALYTLGNWYAVSGKSGQLAGPCV